MMLHRIQWTAGCVLLAAGGFGQQPADPESIRGTLLARPRAEKMLFLHADAAGNAIPGAAPVAVRLGIEGEFAATLRRGDYLVAIHPPCSEVILFQLAGDATAIRLAPAASPGKWLAAPGTISDVGYSQTHLPSQSLPTVSFSLPSEVLNPQPTRAVSPSVSLGTGIPRPMGSAIAPGLAASLFSPAGSFSSAFGDRALLNQPVTNVWSFPTNVNSPFLGSSNLPQNNPFSDIRRYSNPCMVKACGGGVIMNASAICQP